MANQIRVAPRIDLQRLLPVAMAAALLLGACDESKGRATAEKPAPPATLEGELALVEAQSAVRTGLRSAFSSSIRKGMKSDSTPQKSEREFAEEGERLGIIFTSNNRGEREDCGCKSNPLGGLARRHTLIDFARDGGDEARAWWGEPSAPLSPVFLADAGDLFFKSANVDRMSEWDQKVAKIDARTVAQAMAKSPPDAYVASELDLAFGPDYLAELAELGKVPVVSANLASKGELIFPASRVVERDGLKVGFIGITKPESRLPQFYSSRQLEARPFVASYRAAVKGLPVDLDLVVLLSNAGVPETSTAIETLVAAGDRVDLALVSNSNRLLREPSWSSGVPLVEPMSRGKYLGRVDLVLRGDSIAFIDQRRTPDDLERGYRRAQGAWLNTENRRLLETKRLIEARMQVRDRAAAADSDGGGPKGPGPNIDFLEKRVETLARQSAIAHDNLMKIVGQMRAIEEGAVAVDGDDEIYVRTAEVKLAVPEEPTVKRIVESAEKTKPPKPAAPKRKVDVPPRRGGGHHGHDH